MFTAKAARPWVLASEGRTVRDRSEDDEGFRAGGRLRRDAGCRVSRGKVLSGADKTSMRRPNWTTGRFLLSICGKVGAG